MKINIIPGRVDKQKHYNKYDSLIERIESDNLPKIDREESCYDKSKSECIDFDLVNKFKISEPGSYEHSILFSRILSSITNTITSWQKNFHKHFERYLAPKNENDPNQGIVYHHLIYTTIIECIYDLLLSKEFKSNNHFKGYTFIICRYRIQTIFLEYNQIVKAPRKSSNSCPKIHGNNYNKCEFKANCLYKSCLSNGPTLINITTNNDDKNESVSRQLIDTDEIDSKSLIDNLDIMVECNTDFLNDFINMLPHKYQKIFRLFINNYTNGCNNTVDNIKAVADEFGVPTKKINKMLFDVMKYSQNKSIHNHSQFRS